HGAVSVRDHAGQPGTGAKRGTVQQAMAGGNRGGGSTGIFVYHGLHEGQRTLAAERGPAGGEQQYAGSRHSAVRTVHVPVRDCLVVAAGGDHRRGGHGEEKNLGIGSSGDRAIESLQTDGAVKWQEESDL